MAGAWAAVVIGGLAAGPAAADTTWQKITPSQSVTGIDGKSHRATCSGYPGTDKTFSFWTRRGTSRNLLVYFEGGGACWDDLTCTFPEAGLPADVPQFYTAEIPKDTKPASFDGIFKAGDAANPVKDWNAVYIPYCTGDLHIGSATKVYQNAGHPVFPLPSTFPIQHRGYDNFMVVLDWIRRSGVAPDKVLVAGSSAGGYGATVHSPWIQRAYPKATMSVLADASNGITTRAFDTGNPGRNSWNPQVATWVFGSNPSRVSGPDLMRVAAKAQPEASFGQFTTAYDESQIAFYGLIEAYYPPGGKCSNVAIDWHSQMVGALKSTATGLSNYRYYVADGQYHTMLESPQFYAEISAGVTVRDWAAHLLAARPGDDDRGSWLHAACPTCLYIPTCQP
jgi:hypothetical protein